MAIQDISHFNTLMTEGKVTYHLGQSKTVPTSIEMRIDINKKELIYNLEVNDSNRVIGVAQRSYDQSVTQEPADNHERIACANDNNASIIKDYFAQNEIKLELGKDGKLAIMPSYRPVLVPSDSDIAFARRVMEDFNSNSDDISVIGFLASCAVIKKHGIPALKDENTDSVNAEVTESDDDDLYT